MNGAQIVALSVIVVLAISGSVATAGLLPTVLFFGWIAWLSWGKRKE